MTSHPLEVAPEALYAECRPEDLAFETTEGLPRLEGTAGQRRALSALDFGLQIRSQGYNLFVVGIPGSGRTATVMSGVDQMAKDQPLPDDWCYVHNFEDVYRPRALRLPAGMGPDLHADLNGLIDRCKREIPRLFDSASYQQHQQQIAAELERNRGAIFEQLQGEANKRGFTVQFGPNGVMPVPIAQGKPMSPEEYQALPEPQKQAIRQQGEQLGEQVTIVLRQVRELEHQAAEQLRQLERESGLFAVGHLVDALTSKYKSYPELVAHLKAVKGDIVDHLEIFGPQQEAAPPGPIAGPSGPIEDPFSRYRVNVLVTRAGLTGAPVVLERNPTYYNLIGRVEYRPSFGGMSTDFRMIKPGALQRANGGYLVLPARQVLMNPMAWEALKRAIDSQEAVIENLGDTLSAVPTLTVRPEPIPIQVKVILIGTPLVHDMLYQGDEDYSKLFKVKVDFDVEMDRTPKNIAIYAGYISTFVEQEGLLHFDKTAVAKVVEYGSRLLENQRKLSTRFVEIGDLATEASHWAKHSGSQVVTAEHVRQAIDEKESRLSMARDKMQNAIRDGIITIATDGSAVGQMNGLSVLQTADYVFGVPSRISARVALGSAGVVDIEREIAMSGRIHSKGVMILAGYISGKYAQDAPLSLAASLTFEQLYNDVDGDSASCAELCCLLSALADVPLNQSLAMTGSVDQNGDVQAIGGAQYKIEGFFDTCRGRGLTGQQGVILPASNVQHLMLRRDVVEAVRSGQFHIYAAQRVDECFELLTGVTAGIQQPDGSYLEGTLNHRIQQRLQRYAERLRQFGAPLSRSQP